MSERSGSIDLVYVPWRVNGSDHSTFIMVGFRRIPAVMAAGWGWDDEHPLRPWPRLTTTTPKGNPGYCLSLCGFFLAYAYVRRFYGVSDE